MKKAKWIRYLCGLLVLLFVGAVITQYFLSVSFHDAKLETMVEHLTSHSHPPGTEYVTTLSEIGIIDTGNWDRCDYYVGECRRTRLEPVEVRGYYNMHRTPSSEYSLSVFFFSEEENEHNDALGLYRHPGTWGLQGNQDGEWCYYVVSIFSTGSRAFDHRCY